MLLTNRFIVGDTSGRMTRDQSCTLINGIGKIQGGYSYSDLRGNPRLYQKFGFSYLIAQRPEQVSFHGGFCVLLAFFEDVGDKYDDFSEVIYIENKTGLYFDLFLKIEGKYWDHCNFVFEDGRRYHFEPCTFKEEEKTAPLLDQEVEKLEENKEVSDVIDTIEK